RTESWAQVRDALLREYAGARVVCYDHRGHGDSAAAPHRTYQLDQLGRDLRAVLDARAPSGPVVLAGHSMGGMTVLTYAAQNSHEIGTRIVGVALLATAASGIADAGLGRLLRNPAIPLFQRAVRRAPGLMHPGKVLGCTLLGPVVRAAEFGDRRVGPQVLALANAMHNETSIVTMASFLSAFRTYDRTDALPLLARVPTVVLCGSADLMTPPSHALEMAAGIDGSSLVILEGAGHSVILEQPAEVAEVLARLLARVGRSRLVTA